MLDCSCGDAAALTGGEMDGVGEECGTDGGIGRDRWRDGVRDPDVVDELRNIQCLKFWFFLCNKEWKLV